MTTLNRIVFTRDSVLKQEPVQSSQLPSSKRQNISAGTILVVQSYILFSNPDHHKLTLKGIQFKGFSTNWYAFAQHVDVIQDPISPVTSVDTIAAKQQEKNVVKITADRQSVGDQQDFLKMVFNVDTIIKRKPVDAAVLQEQFKQTIPAGTELILLTSKPDANNIVKFPMDNNHVKLTFKDVEFKGFSQDWYAFDKHVGIERVG